MSVAETIRARSAVHSLICSTWKIPPIVKTHASLGVIDGSSTINGEVTKGAVYLVRSPVDVAPSLAKMKGWPLEAALGRMLKGAGKVATNDENLVEPWGSWSGNVESWTREASSRVKVVRYVDLRANPIEHFLGIAAHAGLESTRGEVEPIVEALSLERMRDMVTSGDLVAPVKPVKAKESFVGGGRHYSEVFTPFQIRMILKAFGPTMQRFGFVTDDLLEFARE